MKRLIVLITAATLCGLAASAQEVSFAREVSPDPEQGSGKASVEVNATARFDVNPYFPLQKGVGKFDLNFSNTSIYTFIDGEFGKGWSYSISNHWLGVDWSKLSPEDKLTPLYTNSLHSDNTNWLDWATLTYTLETENAGAWDFTVGKDFMAYALTEYDANDVDCHYDLSSKFWNENSAYQWGASIGWAAPNECSSLKLQVTSSPYSTHPFQDGKISAILKYTEERDWWTGMFSFGTAGCYDTPHGYSLDLGEGEDDPALHFNGKWWNSFATGQKFEMGDVTLSIDGMVRSRGWRNPMLCYLANAKIEYYNEDTQVAVFAKGGIDNYFALYDLKGDGDKKGMNMGFVGVGLHWFPLTDSEDLRVHAVLSNANHFGEVADFDGLMSFDMLSLNVGITYNLALHRFWQK